VRSACNREWASSLCGVLFEVVLCRIPAVFGVVGGKMVDAFVGNVDASRLAAFKDKLLEAARDMADGKAPTPASQLQGIVTTAMTVLHKCMMDVTGRDEKMGWPLGCWLADALKATKDEEALLELRVAEASLAEVAEVVSKVADAVLNAIKTDAAIGPEDKKAGAIAAGVLIRTLVAQGHLDAAEKRVSELSALFDLEEDDDFVQSARASVSGARAKSDALAKVASLKAAAESSPEAYNKYVDALLSAEMVDDAVTSALDRLKSAREDADAFEKAKKDVLSLFSRVGEAHPAVVKGRKALSRLLF
jgi:thioredoxin-like negative regulator of GroEL